MNNNIHLEWDGVKGKLYTNLCIYSTVKAYSSLEAPKMQKAKHAHSLGMEEILCSFVWKEELCVDRGCHENHTATDIATNEKALFLGNFSVLVFFLMGETTKVSCDFSPPASHTG